MVLTSMESGSRNSRWGRGLLARLGDDPRQHEAVFATDSERISSDAQPSICRSARRDFPESS